MRAEDFKKEGPDEQRWILYGTLSRHMVDPNAHRDPNRIKAELKDKGPVVAVLGGLIIILEALGYV